MADNETLVRERIARLLDEVDPKTDLDGGVPGQQYDLGLAWVHFPEGWGGLGLPAGLQRIVEVALAKAGAAADRRTALLRPDDGRPDDRHPRQRRTSRAACCAACSPARTPGASSSASPAPGSDLAGLAVPGRCATATSGSSTARRCGTRWPTSPTGACSSPAPTPTRPSTRA